MSSWLSNAQDSYTPSSRAPGKFYEHRPINLALPRCLATPSIMNGVVVILRHEHIIQQYRSE
jgi:hypothetical protein